MTDDTRPPHVGADHASLTSRHLDDDWERRPSELAEEAANQIWEKPLEDIYQSTEDVRIHMWCEWIQTAVFSEWLDKQEASGR